jgi:hypothetical protein
VCLATKARKAGNDKKAEVALHKKSELSAKGAKYESQGQA